MKQDAFRAWMVGRYSEQSQHTRYHYANKVEEHYGDLDRYIDSDTVEDLLHQLRYSMTDAKSDKPNPTLIPIGGNPYNVLNNCKTGVRTYIAFRSDGGEATVVNDAVIELAAAEIVNKKEGKTFELEQHLQRFLREEIEQLEQGLSIVDGGEERAVASGNIDILAQDSDGRLVVIELKRGLARRETIGQITGYMGDLMAEEDVSIVRGIIVAGDFDKSCKGAVRAVPNLSLKRYRFKFMFDDAVDL